MDEQTSFAVLHRALVRFSMGDGPNRSGASRYRLTSCVEGSLRRLKTDDIDLLQVHMQDIDTPEEETLRALDDLVSQGKVLCIGCSNCAAYRLVSSLWKSDALHLRPQSLCCDELLRHDELPD